MGTNYYWYPKSPCPHCKRPFQRIHIGKSSVGWCFGLHVARELDINDLDDWQHIWETGIYIDPESLERHHTDSGYIENEYGDTISVEDMLDIITNRAGKPFTSNRWYPTLDDFCRHNSAVPGPNNLVRAELSHNHCIKHGSGAWDCIIGEFS